MAHFFGKLKGSRGEVTRCGTKSSGLKCFVNGWDVGLMAGLRYGLGGDRAIIIINGGSNDRRIMKVTRISAKGLEAILDGRAQLRVVKVERGGE